jgi:peroxiredoxin
MSRCHSALLILTTVVGLLQAAGCDKRPNSADSSGADAKTAGPANSASAAAKPSAAPSAGTLRTAQDVLDKMAAAYKNASTYEDFGSLEFRLDPLHPESATRAKFSVTLQRPNRLRIEFFNAKVICDGKQWCAYCDAVPGQAVLREAPAKLSLELLRADDLLYSALNGGGSVPSPQLQLLLEDGSIKNLMNGSPDVSLEEPGRIGDIDCYRVRVNLPEGPQYFWIDQKTFALRQFFVPIPNGPQAAEGGQPARPLWLVFNFERARLGGDIDDPKAFQFDVAEGVKKTRALVQIGPYELVGKKLPEFKFVDLQGKPWSSQSLAGKTAVIHFWKSDVPEAHPMLATISQLSAKYKDNDKVVVLAVNLDPPETPATNIEEAAKQLKLAATLLHDNGMEAREQLKIIELPTTLFIDPKGVLQYCNTEFNPLPAAAAPGKLEKLLAGEDLVPQTRDEFQQRSKKIEKQVDMEFSGEAQTTTVEQSKATLAAAKSEPARLRLKSLWKCVEVHPGNLLVTPDPGGPRIFVIDGFKSVSELGLDGKLIANYKPKIAEKEFFINLRSAAGRDGKRYFAAFAPAEQRFHLFDEKFNHLLSYPADALENPHAGLGDVELGDLTGDGVLKAYVGYAGVVGVQCVSLQGTRIWSCRSPFNVSRVLPGPADAQGHRELYCISDANSLAILDARGQVLDVPKVPGDGFVQYLLHADLTGHGPESWCGILFVPDPQQTSGQFTALGLSRSGVGASVQVEWRYALPAGAQHAVEPIVVGRLLPGAARQWLLPGSDGSIHVLAADGKLIDRFNYGEQVTGLATVEIEGKPVLLISSANGVEALRVE